MRSTSARVSTIGGLILSTLCERAVRRDQDAALLQPVDQDARGIGGRLQAVAVLHQLDAEEQPEPAHVADELVPLTEVLQTLEKVAAEVERVRLQALFLDHVEHRQADGAGDRVAAEGAEELHAVGERVGDLRRGDDGRHRVAVADRLAEDDDVRHHALGLEGPELAADAAEADLHLVGDAEAAGRADVAVGGLEVALGRDDLAAAAEQRLEDEAGDRLLRALESGAHLVAIGAPGRRSLSLVLSAVAVRHGDHVHPRLGPPLPPRPRNLYGLMSMSVVVWPW